jgi:hypothetical protein
MLYPLSYGRKYPTAILPIKSPPGNLRNFIRSSPPFSLDRLSGDKMVAGV